jgi:beta-galactosidase
VHEQDWAQIKDNPKLWGSFIWCMFDFASDHRDEGGQPGLNDKGMVTADRKIKKDAYYFYQANWSDTPMLHITGRRLVDRRNARTEIKVYSNGTSVELKLNGKSLGAVAPDDLHTCRWENVLLQPGKNEVEAAVPGTPLTDQCAWTYAAFQP